MDQTVGIRLNMLASSQAPSLSKSIKHNFITTLQLLVGEEVRLWDRQSGGEEKKIPARKERERLWKEGAAGCQVLVHAALC